jgi:cell filamentation protein
MHLFQDVYLWAGEFRTVTIGNGQLLFARPEHIGPELQKLLLRLLASSFCEGATLMDSDAASH